MKRARFYKRSLYVLKPYLFQVGNSGRKFIVFLIYKFPPKLIPIKCLNLQII
nr:MAG TPA: hypothetical protein [Caudoviricetes sp.]